MIDAEGGFLLGDQFVADQRASIPSPDAANCLTARYETLALDTALAIGFAVFFRLILMSYHPKGCGNTGD